MEKFDIMPENNSLYRKEINKLKSRVRFLLLIISICIIIIIINFALLSKTKSSVTKLIYLVEDLKKKSKKDFNSAIYENKQLDKRFSQVEKDFCNTKNELSQLLTEIHDHLNEHNEAKNEKEEKNENEENNEKNEKYVKKLVGKI